MLERQLIALKKLLAFCMLLFAWSLSPVIHRVLAQSATAKVLGRVTDQLGALLPDATISVTNVETNIKCIATTDDQGFYSISALPIGRYTLTASHDGFASVTSPIYKLEINQAHHVDVTLPIAGTSTTVTLNVQASQIEAADSTIGYSITDRSIVDLPLNGRNPFALAGLMPGVLDTDPDNTGAGRYSIAGGRSDSVTYLLDGGGDNDLRAMV